MRHLVQSCAAVLCVFSALCGPAGAQFPERAVTLAVPLPQGDIAHTTARLIAGKLTEHWGRAVFADARPANAGTDAIAEAAKAKPDGHVLLVGTVATHAVQPLLNPSLPYDAQKAFVPVTLLIEVPIVILVNPSTKAQSPRDLAALAKPKAPPLKSVSAGGGNPAQVAALLFETISKIPLAHADAKDHAHAVKELAGSVAVAFVPVHEALEPIKSGKVRAVAVTSAQRSPALPRLQTVAESGFHGYEISSWAGLFAPAGTAAAILDKIARDAGRAVTSSDARHALEQRGVMAIGSGPAQFRARIERDRERYGRILKERGLVRG